MAGHWAGDANDKTLEVSFLEPHVVSIVRSSTNIHLVSWSIITSLACNPTTMSLVDVSPAFYAHTPIDAP